MEYFEKLIEDGMSVNDILKKAKEAEARVAEKKKQNIAIEEAKNNLINSALAYFKMLGIDLSVANCNTIISSLTKEVKDGKEIDKILADFLKFNEASKCDKRKQDAEMDEILNLFKRIF